VRTTLCMKVKKESRAISASRYRTHDSRLKTIRISVSSNRTLLSARSSRPGIFFAVSLSRSPECSAYALTNEVMQVPKKRIAMSSSWDVLSVVETNNARTNKNSTNRSEMPSRKAPFFEERFFARATAPSTASRKKARRKKINPIETSE